MDKPRIAGICVFCGRTGVTKQHVFPDWISKIIPRLGHSHSQYLIFGAPDHQSNVFFVVPEIRSSRGPLLARKIRNVCKSCNSGWMSHLEVSAKDCLKNMILDQPTMLNDREQSQVSAWVTMTCTMAEFTDVRSVAIPAENRAYLMKSKLPPVGWRIFLGRSTDDEFAYSHTGSAMMTEGSEPPKSANTQTSTFKIGALLVHAVSSTLFDASVLSEKLPNHLKQIWPRRESTIQWPPEQTIDSQQLAELKGSHSHYFCGLQI
ncbi:MAG: hypothetical protein ABIP34_14755 [Rhodoferax sp.]|uniref:hypothetical protein n=1 Tax=Rhodoferax sp. TaxID=50421 RepID=UPI0032675265